MWLLIVLCVPVIEPDAMPITGKETVPASGSPALSTLLANSHQQAIGPRLGKLRCSTKANSRPWTAGPNSPAVSTVRESRDSAPPGYVPDPRRPILAGGGQAAAVRRKRSGVDEVGVAAEGERALAGTRREECGGAVVHPDGQQAAAGGEGDGPR